MEDGIRWALLSLPVVLDIIRFYCGLLIKNAIKEDCWGREGGAAISKLIVQYPESFNTDQLIIWSTKVYEIS